MENQVPVFMPPHDRVAQLFPQALGSFPALSATRQGYGGGILSSLHTRYTYHIVRNNDTGTGTNIKPAYIHNINLIAKKYGLCSAKELNVLISAAFSPFCLCHFTGSTLD
jgi:hypothetical protein